MESGVCMYQKNRPIAKSLNSLCLLLVLSISLILSSCGNHQPPTSQMPGSSSSIVYENDATLGSGATAFFLVVDDSEEERTFTIHTDAESVGAALIECGIASGTEGPYGLYIDTVNGKTVNYETDHAYWAFYVNGEYAATGVSETPVEAGAEYALKVES